MSFWLTVPPGRLACVFAQALAPRERVCKRHSMASSNKAQDPAAAAFLAIEEALNLGATGQGAGPAEANPIGTTSADKAKERMSGEREAATPHPGPSRPPRDAAGTLEPMPAAIDEDRLF